MPMNRAGVGRLAIRPVNDRRIAQISGKMLIARSNSIVGRIKSQATARSDRPRTRTAVARKANPSAMPLALFVTDITCPLVDLSSSPADHAAEEGFGENQALRAQEGSLPSCLNTLIQSLTKESSACFDVPLLTTT